jgi:hypothetical protein
MSTGYVTKLFLSIWRVARTINPKTNLGAPYAGFARGGF